MKILTVSIITGISADWTSLATYDPTYDISTQDYRIGEKLLFFFLLLLSENI